MQFFLCHTFVERCYAFSKKGLLDNKRRTPRVLNHPYAQPDCSWEINLAIVAQLM
jgi:hypothetical protein